MELFHLNRLGGWARSSTLRPATLRRDYFCSEVGVAWGPSPPSGAAL